MSSVVENHKFSSNMFAGFLGFGEKPVWCGGTGHTRTVHEEWNDHAGMEERMEKDQHYGNIKPLSNH
jgi:hypothetical protein